MRNSFYSSNISYKIVCFLINYIFFVFNVCLCTSSSTLKLLCKLEYLLEPSILSEFLTKELSDVKTLKIFEVLFILSYLKKRKISIKLLNKEIGILAC